MNILVGISGGIAAYKVPELVRRLRDHDHEVRVVMTEGAQAFITPLTLQAVSGNPVASELLDEQAEAAMGHIELARWADAVLIAPATADVIARMAGGLANDLLTTLCLATAAPVAVAPAMNQQMWAHPATQENIKRLANQGITIYGPAEGEQACGDVGPGRMLEPAELLKAVLEDLLPEIPELGLEVPFFGVAINPRIIDVVNSYLGMESVLHHFMLRRTKIMSNELPHHSQNWHRAPQEKRNCRDVV